MHLYILRHANADTEAAMDDARELSEKGREQAKTVAKFCAHHGIRPDVIFASPLIRAQQTAKPVAKELGMEITTARWLACGATPGGILAQLAALPRTAAVMLVGHQPDLGELIGHLLGASGESVNVRKASFAHIEILVPREGGGRLEFFLPARLM